MSDHLLPYLANCSLLFTEEPLLRRPAATRAAGFGAVEFWWPFAVPVPADHEVDAFTTAIEEAGVALAGLNFFAGDLAGPDCGVLSIPGRSAEFRDNIDVVAGIGERLGVRGFNALYGNRVDDRDLAALADRGYRGWVSLEYKPTGTTEASLAWLPRERRAAPAGGPAAGGPAGTDSATPKEQS